MQAALGSPDFLFGTPLPEYFVARNCLCVSYLLNVRAANGEHGELGSGWCTGSCAPPGSLGDVCLCVFDELNIVTTG